MISKTLQIAEDLLLATPEIKSRLGTTWPPFFQLLLQLHTSLQKGLHPEFNDPLIAAMTYGYYSPAEPIIARILQKHGLDYRFISGKPRRFRALRNGRSVSAELQQVWQRTAQTSVEVMAREGHASAEGA